MYLSYLPSLITISRLLLTGPIIWALFANHNLIALSLLILASFTDFLDGWLARFMGWESDLGAFLDPMADKSLLISTFLTLSYLQCIPRWIGTIVIGRDVGILLGILVYRVWIGPLYYRAIFVSKLNTLLQIVFVILLLIQQNLWPLPDILLISISIGMIGTSIISFISYARIWYIKVRNHVYSISITSE